MVEGGSEESLEGRPLNSSTTLLSAPELGEKLQITAPGATTLEAGKKKKVKKEEEKVVDASIAAPASDARASVSLPS